MREIVEKLKSVIKYQIEARGGQINPKDDFNGFCNDILEIFQIESAKKMVPVDYLENMIDGILSESLYTREVNAQKLAKQIHTEIYDE